MTLPFSLDSGLLGGAPDLKGLLAQLAQQQPQQGQDQPDPSMLGAPAVQPDMGGAQPPQQPPFQLTTPDQNPLLQHPLPNPRKSLLARVHDTLVSGLLGNGPQEYQALGATPDQIAAARPSLLSAIIHPPGTPNGRGQWEQNVQHQLEVQSLGAQMQRARQIEAMRQQLFQLFPPPMNGTNADWDKWYRQMYGGLMSLGIDPKDMNAIMQQIIAGDSKQTTEHPVEHIDAGDRVIVVDPLTGKKLAEYPKGAAPKTAEDKQHDIQNTNQILDDFRTDSAKFKAAKDGYDVLKGAIAHPGIASPFAVLDAYARVINPGAVVRQGTMAVLQEMGSYDMKVRRWLEMASKGQWPSDMISSVKGTLDAIMQEHYKGYLEDRQRAHDRAAMAGLDLDRMLPLYPQFGPQGTVTNPGMTGRPGDAVRSLIPGRP